MKKLCQAVFFVTFLLGNRPSLSGQQYLGEVEHFSVENGLSSRFVNSIVQDSYGFLWIATDYGLNRYDGHEFRLFSSQNMNWRSDIIWNLMEDPDNYLWISTKTRAGFYIIDLQDIYFLHLPTLQSLSWEERFPAAPIQPPEILQFYLVEKTIYLTTNQGQIYRYDGRFSLLFENRDIQIRELTFLNQGRILVNAVERTKEQESLYLEIDREGKLLRRLKTGFFWQFIKVDKDGARWISNLRAETKKLPGLIYKLSDAGEELTHEPFENLSLPFNLSATPGDVVQLEPEPTVDALWYIQRDGVMLFHPDQGLIFDLTPLLNGRFAHVGNSMITHGEGLSGWVFALNSGDGFYHYSIKRNNFRNLIPNASRNILQDDFGNTYVQTQEGMFFRNAKSGDLTAGYPFRSYSVTLLKDRQGDIWSEQLPLGRFFRFNPATQRLDTLAAAMGNYRGGEVWSLFESSRGEERFWVGADKGLYRTTFPPAVMRPFVEGAGGESLMDSRILAFLETATDSIWLSTSNGLFLIHPEEGIKARYHKDEKGDRFLPLRHANHTYRDEDGIFWIATRGDGMVRWDRQNHKFQSFKVDQGLSHNIIYSVYEDAQAGLWLSSDRGLMRFDKNTHQVRTFLQRDGLPHEEFNTASHFQSKDGELWFGGLGGVVVFHPDSMLTDYPSAHLTPKITEFQIFDGSAGKFVDQTAAVRNSGKVVLAPGDKEFFVKFSLFQYDQSSSNLFGWKIEGWSPDWQYQNGNTLRIVGLQPGSYRLLVKAQGLNGQWSPEPLSIDILAKKFFYEQTWFYLLAAGLAIGVLYRRFRNIRRAKTELERIVAERTAELVEDKRTIELQTAELRELDQLKSRFFANVSHELRTPLTLMLAPLNQLLQNADLGPGVRKYLTLMQRNGAKLRELVEEILDLSKIDANKMTVQESPTDLETFINRIVSAFQSQAEILQIRYIMEYRAKSGLLLLTDQHKLEHALTNLLSNAFKHTPAGGRIQVTVWEEAEQIGIEVADTGEGIHPDDLPYIFDRFFQTRQTKTALKGGTGIGLALTKEYLQLLGAGISVQSTLGQGSAFRILLPEKEAPAVMTRQDRASRPAHRATAKNTAPQGVLAQQDSDAKIDLLLVEDNLDMQQFLREILEEFGEVRVAMNGKVALEMLRAVDPLPGLIVSDVMMPEMDGFALLEQLRATEKWRHVPVVMLTARAEKQDRLRGLLLGVDDYLIKPFDVDELKARVRNIISRIPYRFPSMPSFSLETLPSNYDQWLKELEEKAFSALDRQFLSVSQLAYDMALSERQLRRKIKELTGLSPKEYLREAQLQKARQLLENRSLLTVAEVAYKVGFAKPDYFSKLFILRYGKTPSSYL